MLTRCAGSITVALQPAIGKAIEAIPEADWVDIDYTIAGQAQVAETTYTVGGGRTKSIFFDAGEGRGPGRTRNAPSQETTTISLTSHTDYLPGSRLRSKNTPTHTGRRRFQYHDPRGESQIRTTR